MVSGIVRFTDDRVNPTAAMLSASHSFRESVPRMTMPHVDSHERKKCRSGMDSHGNYPKAKIKLIL